MQSFLGSVLSTVFPVPCAGCGGHGEPLCEECLLSLRPAFITQPPAGIDAWCAPFAYEGAARELIARVKYRDQRHAVSWLTTAVARSLRQQSLCEIDIRALRTENAVVGWIPTTRARRSARGFDHAELFARKLSRELGMPVRGVLRRVDTFAQTGRSIQQRQAGPQFRAVCRPPRSVLLVDDVATSGATLRNAAKVLRCAGTVAVCAATFARTPPAASR